jgi:hypothetical protein
MLSFFDAQAIDTSMEKVELYGKLSTFPEDAEEMQLSRTDKNSVSFSDTCGDMRTKDVKALVRRIRQLECRQQSVEEHFVQKHLANSGSTPTLAQWSHMKDEIERVRRLFEFLESVLPHETAETMRFFNRSRSEKSRPKDSEAVDARDEDAIGQLPSSEIELEFEKHIKRIEAEMRQSRASVHHEVSNCMQAIKVLQRDMDITRGALLVDRPKFADSTDAPRSSPARPPTNSDPSEAAMMSRVEEIDSSQSGVVSRQQVLQDIAHLREEIKTWFDQLRDTVKGGLSQKVDKSQAFITSASDPSLLRRSFPSNPSPCSTPFDSKKPHRKAWRPSSSPGVNQIRAPGASLCGPNSLPKFPHSALRDAKPFGQETARSLNPK